MRPVLRVVLALSIAFVGVIGLTLFIWAIQAISAHPREYTFAGTAPPLTAYAVFILLCFGSAVWLVRPRRKTQ